MPGQFIPGADSHSRAYGAYGAVGIGVGSTTLGFGWSTGYIYFTLAKARRVVFSGRLQPWVSGKDIVLELLRRWGAKQSQGMSVEFVDADRQLPIVVSQHDRQHDGGGRGAERHLRARRDHLRRGTAQKGITTLPYPRFSPGADARLRDRRDARPERRPADDRQAVQPGQRVSGRGGRARAHHVRQGDDRVVHQRQLRRSAAGRAGAARGARRGREDGRARVHDLPGIGRRRHGRSSCPIRGSAASRSPTSSARSAARSGSRGAARASARARTR